MQFGFCPQTFDQMAPVFKLFAVTATVFKHSLFLLWFAKLSGFLAEPLALSGVSGVRVRVCDECIGHGQLRRGGQLRDFNSVQGSLLLLLPTRRPWVVIAVWTTELNEYSVVLMSLRRV